MRTEDIQYIVAVYNARSITKAAEIINISPQGLGKALRAIEKDLNCTLFIRTHHGIRPTPICDYIYDDLNRLYERSEKIRQKISDYTESDGQTQSIVCVKSVLSDKIDEALAEYNAKFGKRTETVALQISEPDTLKVFDENNYDYRIATKELLSADVYKYYTLSKLEFFPVVGLNSPLCGKDKIKLEDFKDLTLVVESRSKAYATSFLKLCSKHGFEPKVKESYEKYLIPNLLAKDPNLFCLLQKADINRTMKLGGDKLKVLELEPPFGTTVVIQCRNGRIDPELLHILRGRLVSYSETYLD